MTIIIAVKQEKKHGLETHSIYVNGTLLNTFMSEAEAETRKQQIMYAWNIEKVGQVKHQRKAA